MRALLDNFAVHDDDHLIRVADDGQAVGDDETGAVPAKDTGTLREFGLSALRQLTDEGIGRRFYERKIIGSKRSYDDADNCCDDSKSLEFGNFIFQENNSQCYRHN